MSVSCKGLFQRERTGLKHQAYRAADAGYLRVAKLPELARLQGSERRSANMGRSGEGPQGETLRPAALRHESADSFKMHESSIWDLPGRVQYMRLERRG